MSSGTWHNRATILTASIVGLGTLAFSGQPLLASVSFFAGLSGILLTPDLDQPTLNKVENQLVKSQSLLIKIFGLLYIGFFAPYSRLFAHRSFWTHYPIIGTLGRLIYIILALGTIRLCGYLIDSAILYVYMLADYQLYIIFAIAMLMLVDAVHYIMDYWIQFK